MKSLIWKLGMAVVLGTGFTGWAAIDFTGSGGSYSATSPGSQVIADYPSSGVAYALNFNFAGASQITDITVTFTTTGGWNGDLYAYLSHGSGLAILLNRVGANAAGEDGYSTPGFNNITLTTSGTDIHGVASPTPGGSYAADGRVDYTSSTRANTLSVFNGVDPNGSWTLYFGDLSPLDVSTLSSWSVGITAVPEPVNMALGLFGLCVAGAALVRRFRAPRPA